MEKKIWTWLAVTAAICGLLAIVCWSIVIYLFVNTPNVHEIIVSSDHGGPQVRGKASALFFPAVYQTLIFAMTLAPVVRFKKMIQKVAERVAPLNIWETTGGGPRYQTTFRIWCLGMYAISGINLYSASQSIEALLHQQ